LERIALDSGNIAEAAARAGAVLRAGGVVLYPTDTLYGLGADALSDEAVARVVALKGRDEKKPIHALVDSLEMAERYGQVDEVVRALAQRLPRGKVTFIVKKCTGDTGIMKGIGTFGFRIPDSEFCLAMIRAFGGPVTATSANVAGEEPQRSVDAIAAQFEHSHILKNVRVFDMVVDGGELPVGGPSTVLDLSGETPVVLREGAVPAAAIRAAVEASR
jgi:L-threonylcarbamoyladenylate synthase